MSENKKNSKENEKRLSEEQEQRWDEEDFKENGPVYADETDSEGRIIQLRPTPIPPGY